MPVIGLTGGIGSGKSCIAKRLKKHGLFVLDADKISRALTRCDSVVERLTLEFGEDILLPSGVLDRKALSAIVFTDKSKLLRLNEIMHPLILERIRLKTEAILKNDPKRLIVWDVPLLIESGLYRETDIIWVVTANKKTRIDRLKLRSGMTPDVAQKRINAQLSDEDRITYADIVITNDGTIDELYKKTDDALNAARRLLRID